MADEIITGRGARPQVGVDVGHGNCSPATAGVTPGITQLLSSIRYSHYTVCPVLDQPTEYEMRSLLERKDSRQSFPFILERSIRGSALAGSVRSAVASVLSEIVAVSASLIFTNSVSDMPVSPSPGSGSPKTDLPSK
jgi:hypothetical protein